MTRFVALLVLFACLSAGGSASAQTSVTFAKDVAPIIYSKCGVCHRPGGSAPFSLLTYASARSHATQIAAITRSGVMPPWQADGDYGGEFIGQPRLTPAELDILQRWGAEGAPEGDPSKTPPAPHWTEGWQLGTPDLIVSPPSYTLQADGTDIFRIFVIKLPVDGVKFVRGMEFKPGNARVVHHANIRIDHTDASRKFDDADPGPGYSGLIATSAIYPDGHFLGWTPGQVPPLLPKGLAWRLQPNTDLVVELHMQPSGKAEQVAPSIGLYFGDQPPTHIPVMLRLGRQNIDIPAGDAKYVVTDSYTLPVDVELEAVQPHAHYRARDVRGEAVLPDGSRKPIIDIADWDFRWQHVYRFVTPMPLPRGTKVSMRYTYDNSAANPRNPQRPPVRARWGQRSAEEMGDLWLQVLPRDDLDLELLSRDFRQKAAAEDVKGYEVEIEKQPGDVGLHDDVALLYLELGQSDRAIAHFRATAMLRPQSAIPHYNLGTALTVARRLDEAAAEYREALRIDPSYANAHNNLGNVLLSQKRYGEAIGEFEEVVRLQPGSSAAKKNLAAARAMAERR